MNYFLKFSVSLLIGAVLLYFSVKDVNFSNLRTDLPNVNLILVFYAVLISVFIIFLKSIRYSLLLNPIKKIGQKELMPILIIGLMAIVIIPLRMGEFVRPYLISRKENIRFSSATTAVFIERLFEVALLLCMVFYCLSITDTGSWIAKPILIISILFVALFVFLIFVIGGKNVIKRKIKKFVKSDLHYVKIDELYDNIHKAFYIFKYPVIVAQCILYSIVIWVLSAFSIHLILIALKISLPFSASVLIMVVTILGISIPGAPGFVGNYQFANMFALSLYNVNNDKAMLFSIIYYLSNIGIDILLGAIVMPFVNISIKEFLSVFTKIKK
jgi:glycosyltransferase 2 family protein